MTEHTGTVERQLEKLRRDFGDVFLAALADPETVEILLNPDGTLWQERLGEKPVQIGSMARTKASCSGVDVLPTLKKTSLSNGVPPQPRLPTTIGFVVAQRWISDFRGGAIIADY